MQPPLPYLSYIAIFESGFLVTAVLLKEMFSFECYKVELSMLKTQGICNHILPKKYA